MSHEGHTDRYYPTPKWARVSWAWVAATLSLGAVAVGSCGAPIEVHSEQEMREYLMEAGHAEEDIVFDEEGVIVEGDMWLGYDTLDQLMSAPEQDFRGYVLEPGRNVTMFPVCMQMSRKIRNSHPVIVKSMISAAKAWSRSTRTYPSYGKQSWRTTTIDIRYEGPDGCAAAGYDAKHTLSVELDGDLGWHTWALAPYPSLDGRIGPWIRFNPTIEDRLGAGKIRQVALHEMGHTIGYQHRACESSDNTCYHIPGTADGDDYGSVMRPYTYEFKKKGMTYLRADDHLSNDWFHSRKNQDDPECPVTSLESPDWSLCSAECPCGTGMGDCDNDSECKYGLTCGTDKGQEYGLSSGFDICVAISDRGYNGCPAFSSLHPDGGLCDNPDCPCGPGEGDCDDDFECAGSLVCDNQLNNGAAVGLPADYDVCTYPPSPLCPVFDRNNRDTGFCSDYCKCGFGEGDCDSDNECRPGLKCDYNVGDKYGLPSDWDVCVRDSDLPIRQ